MSFSDKVSSPENECTLTTSSFMNSRQRKIACRYWAPSGKPKVLVYICHGMGEYSLSYDTFAKSLVNEGYLVFSHDHEGHGLSEGKRLDISHFEDYCKDVFQHIDIMKEKYPGMPMFAVAHSMGGAVCFTCLISKPDLFKGIIYVAPAFKACTIALGPVKTAVVNVVGRVLPWMPAGYLDYNLVSTSKEDVERFFNDPLYCHGYYKAGFALKLLNSMENIQSHFVDVKYPFLVLAADNDKLCDLKAMETMHEVAPSTDKHMIIYPKAYHGLFVEPNGVKEKVMNESLEWLKARCQ